MKVTEYEFECMVRIETGVFIKDIKNDMQFLYGFSSKSFEDMIYHLCIEGLLVNIGDEDYVLTEKGILILEPYRVKRAIILAAGMGNRMAPITNTIPKPLVSVNGQVIIEGLINALLRAKITNIIIVVGYLKEKFEYLITKYPTIELVVNQNYIGTNNISSIRAVKERLNRTYVLEGDLILYNSNLIRKYEFTTNYLGYFTKETTDWCFKTNNKIIEDFQLGGLNVYHMYGISYWNEHDGILLKEDIEYVFKMQDGPQKYWDEVALRYCADHYKIQVRPILKDNMIEIDTLEELQKVDSTYLISNK